MKKSEGDRAKRVLRPKPLISSSSNALEVNIDIPPVLQAEIYPHAKIEESSTCLMISS